MEAIGVIVLRGNQVDLTINGTTIHLFGVDDPDTGLTMSQLEGFAPQEDALSLLLSHRLEVVVLDVIPV